MWHSAYSVSFASSIAVSNLVLLWLAASRPCRREDAEVVWLRDCHASLLLGVVVCGTIFHTVLS